MIPGSNLLDFAMTLIDSTMVAYYQATGRTVNDVGQDVTSYAAPVNVAGSLQPVSRKLYKENGLDWQKSYFIFYTQTNMIDTQRNVSADKIVFNGSTYLCESDNADWYAIDGWESILCVLVNGAAG